MHVPDDIVEEVYGEALTAYYRTLAEHIAFRSVKSSQERERTLHEQALNVAAMEASWPCLKNLRRERELKATAATGKGLDAKFLLPRLRHEEVE